MKIPFETDEDLFYLRKWLFYKDGKEYVTTPEFKDGFLEWSKNWSVVWNKVMEINLLQTLKKVDCPIYFFVGKNDIQTSAKIATQYYTDLKTPYKELFLFENSGHQIHLDESEKFQKTIIEIFAKQ